MNTAISGLVRGDTETALALSRQSNMHCLARELAAIRRVVRLERDEYPQKFCLCSSCLAVYPFTEGRPTSRCAACTRGRCSKRHHARRFARRTTW